MLHSCKEKINLLILYIILPCTLWGKTKYWDPYSKKRILGLRLSPGLESQGCQPNICFLLNHASRENKYLVGTPAILIRVLISGPGFVFLNMGLWMLKLKVKFKSKYLQLLVWWMLFRTALPIIISASSSKFRFFSPYKKINKKLRKCCFLFFCLKMSKKIIFGDLATLAQGLLHYFNIWGGTNLRYNITSRYRQTPPKSNLYPSR